MKCTTCHGETIQGEVSGFDYTLKMLMLKCPSMNCRPELNDTRIINLSNVSNVEVVRESPNPPKPPTPLPSLNHSKLNTRRKTNIEDKMRKLNYIGTGVSPIAQKLVDTIVKTIPEVEWSGEKILVMKNVMINPPYSVDDCQVTDSQVYQNGQTLNHVRKIVQKFHDDNKERVSSPSSSSTSSTPPTMA